MNAVKLQAHHISCSSQALAQNTFVQAIWLDLMQKAAPNFFLHWTWISSWLVSINESVDFIYAVDKKMGTNTPIEEIPLHCIFGCAVIHKNSQFSLQNLVFQQASMLNRTGLKNQDQMWIEYNDFLIDQQYENDARDTLAQYTMRHKLGSLQMGITDTKLVEQLCQRNNWQYAPISQTLAYQKTISPKHEDIAALIADFSKNTKSQLRRSIKLLKENDDLQMSIAESCEQATQWFEDSGDLHKSLWQSTAYGSGFDNPIFIAFHKRLIAQLFSQGHIVVAKYSLNNSVVGYIYGFIYQQTFHFYLSAFAKSPNSKIKLGLVAHLYLMQLLASKNICVYDFMGGTARYKESLSDTRISMGFYRITNNAFMFKLDKLLRDTKQKLSTLKQKRSMP